MNESMTRVDRAEIERFEQAVESYLAHEMDPERFMFIRLQQGVYGQRQEGLNMVRVKIPGGQLGVVQIEAIADCLERYSTHHSAHVTTRQDIQLHFVPLPKTPAVLRRLAEAGLTTREACNNTIRNITMCPLAGVCPRERVAICEFKEAAVAYLLRHPLTQHLPRKFKTSFSGCEADCAQGMIHDLGIVAVREDGRAGFRVLAGGGLGHKPHEAIVLERLLPEEDLLPAIEAVVSLHHRYSDRTRRAKSRLKFLVQRFGVDGFIARYREEFGRTRAAVAAKPRPRGTWREPQPGPAGGAGAPRTVITQRQAGLHAVPVSLPIGDIRAEQLRAVAHLMRAAGLTEVRTTQDQNLLLLNVPAASLPAVHQALAQVGLGAPKAGDDCVACPGTSTCRLGITSSKVIGARLSGGPLDLRIRVSGCQNGCAQPETGDIGIYGQGKRLHGKLIPHYQMYFGGDGRANGGIAIKGPEVPAARIEQAIELVKKTYAETRAADESFFAWTRRQARNFFHELLAPLIAVAPHELAAVQSDHGESAPFRVLQLGGGECAGAMHEHLASNFSEAAYERACRNAFIYQREYDKALECVQAIARLVGQALLSATHLPPAGDLAGIARALRAAQPAIAERLADIARRHAALSVDFDAAAFSGLNRDLDAWMDEAARLCMALDAQLDLTLALAEKPVTSAFSEVVTLDLSGHPCPANYLLARVRLEQAAAGDELELILESGQPARSVTASLEADGHVLVRSEETGATTRVRVRRRPAVRPPAAQIATVD